MFRGKEAFIFDLDGTLIDRGIYDEVDREIIIRGGGIPNQYLLREKNKILEEKKDCNAFIEIAKFLKNEYHLSLSIEEIDNLRQELVREKCLNLCYKPGADTFLKELKKRGFILALATISYRWQIDIYKNENKNIINACDFKEVFGDNILAFEDVSKIKPSSEVYNKMIEILGIERHKCLVIEDSLHGVKAAKGAGLQVLSIYDKYSDIDRDYINSLSDYTANNFSELVDKLNAFTRRRIK